LAREAIRSLDEIVWVADSGKDTLEHLVSYLTAYAREFLSVTPIRLRLDIPERIPPCPMTLRARHNLLLVAKEALHNAVKHAAPMEIRLRLNVAGDQFELMLADDGRGFVVSEADSVGNGLVNMRERMQEIGGTFEIASRAAQGTTIRLTIPIPLSARKS
jgi:signal transduction histidine kinase